MKDLVFLGATSFPEISEVVRDINQEEPRFAMRAILDDNTALHGSTVEDVPVEGPLDKWREYPDAQFVFGIASHANRLLRFEILRRLSIPRECFATLVHPRAKIYSTAKVGNGCIVMCGAVVACGSVVEDFVQVLGNSIIGANNLVCEGALITSLVVTTAKVILGPFCHIGAGSTIAPGIAIAAGAQVGVGSVVLRDVPVGGFVLGNPAVELRPVAVSEQLIELWQRVIDLRQ